jgi:hypothetical protein
LASHWLEDLQMCAAEGVFTAAARTAGKRKLPEIEAGRIPGVADCAGEAGPAVLDPEVQARKARHESLPRK